MAVLGELRSAAADLSWLRMAYAWEKRDAVAVETALSITTTIDPAPLYFWLNGSRIVAGDIAEWRIAEGMERGGMSPSVQKQIRYEQAQKALRRLDEAAVYHHARAALWIERANLELTALDDPAAAAESFRHASEQTDAPYSAPRLYAELLVRLNRKPEALAWLTALYANLPQADPAARADVVLARIRRLEDELQRPLESRYLPAPFGRR